jgi:flagella basal body P-ring formation protein FlgA
MNTKFTGSIWDSGCREGDQGMQVRVHAPRIPHPASLTIRSYTSVVVLIAIGVAAATARATDVKLRERVVPKSSVVRLGDVAEVTSTDRQEARQLAVMPLMPAPPPGMDRILRQREVADMLAANGVVIGSLRFVGAERVAVAGPSGARTAAINAFANSTNEAPIDRRAAILAAGQGPVTAMPHDDAHMAALKTKLRQIIGDHVSTKSGKHTLDQIDCDVTEQQLAQFAAATTTPTCDGGSQPWSGRQRFVLSFETATGPVRLPVFADIAEAAVPTVFATRSVPRGSVITAVDVELRTIERSGKLAGPRALLDSIEKIIGMEVRQPLQAGEVVWADQVQSPVLVKRGDLISVSSQGGGIRVRTDARALQEGANGDLIQVESLESKQRYDARVVGSREAAVFAPARVSAPQDSKASHTARQGHMKSF